MHLNLIPVILFCLFPDGEQQFGRAKQDQDC